MFNKVFLLYVSIVLLGAFLFGGVYLRYQADIRDDKINYINEERHKSREAALRINQHLRDLYQGLRTLARLPGVRSIDRHANNFDENANKTFQEVYNNIAANVKVSEIYIVPVDLDPDLIDPVTQKPELPIKMYDQLIVGKTAISNADDKNISGLPEVEIFEYRLLKQQMAMLKVHFGLDEVVNGLDTPAISGPEVITCDNSLIFPKHLDDRDRSGIVYSVPFYDLNGNLKGTISGIFLTQILRDLLPSNDYAMLHLIDHYTVYKNKDMAHPSMKWIEAAKPDPALIYSEIVSLSIPDIRGRWQLWAGHSNDVFWQRDDVISDIKATQMGCLTVSLLLALLLSGVWFWDRQRRLLYESNIRLEVTVLQRTQELERKKHEAEKLALSLKDQKNALDQSSIVAITDVKGIINYANDNFCKISKYSREELLGQDHRIVNSGQHSKEFMREMWRTIANGEIWKGEIKNKAKDGTYYWVDTTIVPFLNEEGKPFQYVAIRREITEQVKAKEEIIEKSQELEAKKTEADLLALKAQQAAKAKSDFLANMSHEIRTPMNAILGFSELLQGTTLDEKQKEYLKSVSSSGQLLLGIINDILDFSKLESGKVKLESIDFNLEYLLSETFKMIVPRLREKNLDSFLDIAHDVPMDVKGDPTRIKQIVINLLGNAIKFTEHGSIGVTVRLISNTGHKIRLKFDVSDSGIGISQENIKKLFTPFTQADETTTRKFGGTGLGLTICKTLTEAMGGRIWIESQEGYGSHFIFEIEFERGVPVIDRAIQPLSLEELKGKNIMIVDDNAHSREILMSYAKEMGLNVLANCASAKEGLKAVDILLEKNKKIDLIFSDVMMPEMDGYEFCRTIKGNPKTQAIKVLAVTSDIRLGMMDQAKEHKFDGYLPKPFSRTDLMKVVTVMLGDNRSKTDATPVTRHLAEEVGCKGVRVLVVDDVKANQDLLKAFLKILGCECHCLNNGQEAVDYLRGNYQQHDMCLMDLQMPILSGDEATRIIRNEISKDFPIIALTAAALKEDQQKCFDAGMNDYLTKPFNLMGLKGMLLKYGKKFV